MFKQIVTSLALTVGLSLPSIASEPIRMPSSMVCAESDYFFPTIEKYGEIPFAKMISFREVPGVGVMQNVMIIFVNPETKTYTMLEQLSENIVCVVGVGSDILPYRESK